MAWMPSMCAKTLVAVMTLARPYFDSTSSTAAESKNAVMVGIPRASAVLPTSVGSIPTTRLPAFWKFASSVPSFDPMSTTRSSFFRPSSGVASASSSAKFSRRMRVVPLVYA